MPLMQTGPAEHPRRRHKKGLGLVIVGLLIAGGAGLWWNTAACSMAGCFGNGITFEVMGVDLVEATYLVELCIDEACLSEKIDTSVPAEGLAPVGPVISPFYDQVWWGLPGDRDWGGTQHVTLSIADTDGHGLVEWAGTIRFDRYSPNGLRCGPHCHSAHVVVGG